MLQHLLFFVLKFCIFFCTILDIKDFDNMLTRLCKIRYNNKYVENGVINLGMISDTISINFEIIYWLSDRSVSSTEFKQQIIVPSGVKYSRSSWTRDSSLDDSSISNFINNSSNTAYASVSTATVTIEPIGVYGEQEIICNFILESNGFNNQTETLIIKYYVRNNWAVRTSTPSQIYLGNNLLSDELPIGTIVMFYGEKLNELPNNWHVCDGTNGTPNLNDKIVIGSSYLDYSYGGTRNIADPFYLNENNIPDHLHNYYVKLPKLKGEDRQDNKSENLKNHGVSTIDSVSDNSDISTEAFTYTTNHFKSALPSPIDAPYYQRLIFIMKIK